MRLMLAMLDYLTLFHFHFTLKFQLCTGSVNHFVVLRLSHSPLFSRFHLICFAFLLVARLFCFLCRHFIDVSARVRDNKEHPFTFYMPNIHFISMKQQKIPTCSFIGNVFRLLFAYFPLFCFLLCVWHFTTFLTVNACSYCHFGKFILPLLCCYERRANESRIIYKCNRNRF